MKKSDVQELLELSFEVSKEIEEFNNYKNNFLKRIIEKIDSKVDLKKLPKEWFNYYRNNKLTVIEQYYVEEELGTLMKNYEKLKSSNF